MRPGDLRSSPAYGREKGQIAKLFPLCDYLRPYSLAIIAASIALLFTSGAVLGMGQGLKYLVDHGFVQKNQALLDRSILVLLGVIVALALATYARYYLVSWIGERVVADIRSDIYRRLVAMDVGFFETTQTGELLSRLTTDTTLLQTVVGSSVSVALRNSILLVGGLILLFITSPHLTLYILLIIPAVVAPIVVIGKQVRNLSRQTQSRVADISTHAEETISAIRTIQALSLEVQEADRFGHYVETALHIALGRIRVRAMLTALVISLVLGAIAVVLWIGGGYVITGKISAGELSSFVFYAMIVAASTGALSEVVGDLQRAAGATERLMELKALRPAIQAPENPRPLPSTLSGPVTFDNVTFHYPSRPDTAALDHVSFEVQPGETVALVGPSGAGKSTVMHLLLRFYDAASGRVAINGIPVSEFDPAALRSRIGLVPQDPIIFSTNVRENIRYGRPEATDEEIRTAAKQAEALEFIERLPQGFESHVGEKGVRLSGGQRQRIAIARALVRNPDLLLLDEATSALDSENERKVQRALETLMHGRTTLVIAHRLSTVENANRILVMEAGMLVASGSHSELLKSSELYRRLAQQKLQAD